MPKRQLHPITRCLMGDCVEYVVWPVRWCASHCHHPGAKGHVGRHVKGHPHTEATKQRLREANLGQKSDSALVKKRAAQLRGRKHSPEHVEAIAFGVKQAYQRPEVLNRWYVARLEASKRDHFTSVSERWLRSLLGGEGPHYIQGVGSIDIVDLNH